MTRKELLRYIFWEWIEPIGSALAIAFIVMHFVMALYVIPTGSMQPTLHGKGDYPHELGDKVLVNKFIYRFQKPKWWDVIVFEYPFHTLHCNRCGWEKRDFPKDQPKVIPEGFTCPSPTCYGRPQQLEFIDKEYIKRCVAIPGDEVSVRDGNIVLKKDGQWSPSIKTDLAQEALWISVFDSSNPQQMALRGQLWQSTGSRDWVESWSASKPLQIGGEGEQAMFFYEQDALRGYGDKGVNGGHDPRDAPPVGDVLMDLSLVAWPSEGELVLEISRNLRSYQFVANFKDKAWKVIHGQQILAQGAFPKEHRFQFARLDGRLEVTLDGQRQGFPIAESILEETTSIMPKLRLSGVRSLDIAQLRVLRDIYYTRDNTNFFTGDEESYTVRSGEYFAMGDNSYHSSDSRIWGPVPEENLIGTAIVVILPFSRIKFIH